MREDFSLYLIIRVEAPVIQKLVAVQDEAGGVAKGFDDFIDHLDSFVPSGLDILEADTFPDHPGTEIDVVLLTPLPGPGNLVVIDADIKDVGAVVEEPFEFLITALYKLGTVFCLHFGKVCW